MKILGLSFLKKVKFWGLLRPSNLKTDFFFKLMVAYVHIEYSTYQFSEELKRGGIHPPPRSLRYRKKRGPERVNIERNK